MNRALADMRAQQKSAAQALGLNNVDDPIVVNPAAMAWARALIKQGAITIEQPDSQAGPAIAVPERAQFNAGPIALPPAVAQFIEEQAIATRNANAMVPYLEKARKRVRELENRPTTQQQCDELREQLELYIDDPESYDIRDSDGQCIVLQTQTFRAYSEALSSVDEINNARVVPPPPIAVQVPGRPDQTANGLIQLGFSRHDIVRIAMYTGENRNQERMVQLASELFQHGFSTEGIVRIGARRRGDRNLEKTVELTPELLRLGFSMEGIVRIAANFGGERNLEKTVELASALDGLGFSMEEIVRIAANLGGERNLEKTGELTPVLLELGFSMEGIVRIAERLGGNKNLEKTVELTPALLELGFATEEIVRIAAHIGGNKNLEKTVELTPALLEQEMSLNEIVSRAAGPSGALALQQRAEQGVQQI